jgi:hypothetical protein
LKTVEKLGEGGKEVRESIGGIEQTKVKHTHSGHILKYSSECQLEYLITKMRTEK